MGIAYKVHVMENATRLITEKTMMNIQLIVFQKTSVGQIKAASRKSKIKHQTSQRQPLVFSQIPVSLFLRVFFRYSTQYMIQLLRVTEVSLSDPQFSDFMESKRGDCCEIQQETPRSHGKQRNVFGIPLQWPLDRKAIHSWSFLLAAELLGADWGKEAWESVLTGTFLVSLRSRTRKIYKNKAEVLPALCL